MIARTARSRPDDLVVELASNDGYLLQHFVGTGDPDPRHRSCGERRRARRGTRRADARGVLRPRATAERLVAEGKQRQSRRREQRARAGAGPERLRRRRRDTAHAARHRDVRVSAPCCACSSASSTTRSTTSTSRTSPSRRSCEIFAHTGSTVYDVEEIPTHGGLACGVYAQHADGPQADARCGRRCCSRARTPAASRRPSVCALRRGVKESKRALLELLIASSRRQAASSGYGAPGKGNTLLNYCGIRTDLLEYTVDRNPYKQGMYTPGTHIPIHPSERIAETQPDLRPRPAMESDRRDRRSARLRPSGGRSSSCRFQRPTIVEPGASARPARDGGGGREGRALLRRARRPHGRGDAAHSQADDPRRDSADPLAHHEVVCVVGAHGVHPLPRVPGGDRSRSTSSTTTRRSPTTSYSPTAGSDVELLGADIADWRITFVDTGVHVDDRRAPAQRRAPPRRRRVLPRDVRRRPDRRAA